MMNTCEHFQLTVSALLDGEVEIPETLPVVDHLLQCADCHRFYSQSRALDASVGVEPRDGDFPGWRASDELWRKIENESLQRSIAHRKPPWMYWGVAASLVLAVAGGAIFSRLVSAPEAVPSQIRVVLEGDRGGMNDARFLDLATEILRADRRYHNEMLRLMAVVTEELGGAETAGEDGSSLPAWRQPGRRLTDRLEAPQVRAVLDL